MYGPASLNTARPTIKVIGLDTGDHQVIKSKPSTMSGANTGFSEYG